MNTLLKIFLPLLVLGSGVYLAYELYMARQLPKSKPIVVRGPLVKTMTAQASEHVVELTAHGTVRPKRKVDVTPQVAGVVTSISPNLVEGGFVESGEMLLTIDRRDYELAVEQAKAEVASARVKLAQAKEEAELAKKEWEIMARQSPDGIGERPSADSLVFYGPQLERAKAELAAAGARLKEAELSLTRAVIKAPFRGRVLTETVDAGQYVSSGKKVAEIYGIDFAEVVVPLSDTELRWVGGKLPGLNGVGGPLPEVMLIANFGGSEQRWWGKVVRTTGAIDPQSRMIDLVVEVADPLGGGDIPLAVGMFVEASIKGKRLPQSFALPRYSLSDDGIVWIVDGEGKLRMRRVDVVRMTEDEAIITGGLADGDQVMLTRIDAPVEGMTVRTAEE